MSKKATKQRAALYARVSTGEDRQDSETQLRRLREFADQREFEVTREYVDTGSGRDNDRPEYQKLVRDVRRRAVDVVLVWRYDRFARSTQALIGAVKAFQALGVDFISHQERIDTTTRRVKWSSASRPASRSSRARSYQSASRRGCNAQKMREDTLADRPSQKMRRRKSRSSTHDVSINQIAKRLDIAYGTAWNYVQEVKSN